MLRSKVKLSTRPGSKLVLATAIAALATAALSVGGASAQRGSYPISGERVKALQDCSGLADEWGYAYRACMAQHGQAE